MQSKKKFPILPILICAVLLTGFVAFSVSNFIRTMNYLEYDIEKYKISDFGKSKESFENVVEKMRQVYQDEKEKNAGLQHLILQEIADGVWNFSYEANGEGIDETLTTSISAQIEQDYEKIVAAFAKTGNGGLSTVWVMKDRVVFVSGAPYAVVYMEDGEKPEYMLAEDEAFASIFVERITADWYQVAGK